MTSLNLRKSIVDKLNKASNFELSHSEMLYILENWIVEQSKLKYKIDIVINNNNINCLVNKK